MFFLLLSSSSLFLLLLAAAAAAVLVLLLVLLLYIYVFLRGGKYIFNTDSVQFVGCNLQVTHHRHIFSLFSELHCCISNSKACIWSVSVPHSMYLAQRSIIIIIIIIIPKAKEYISHLPSYCFRLYGILCDIICMLFEDILRDFTVPPWWKWVYAFLGCYAA
jgi:hypothetical protein